MLITEERTYFTALRTEISVTIKYLNLKIFTDEETNEQL